MNPTITRSAGAFVAMLMLALPASAGTVCAESNGSRTSQGCDHTYRDMSLTCTAGTVDPACPTSPMPMKDTPKKSFIKDFSPYLYTYARDMDDASKPYTGNLMRGTIGDPTQSVPVIKRKGLSGENGCVDQIEVPTEGTTPEEQAKLIRLQLDNCANQYILNTSLHPEYRENTTFICPTDYDPAKRCNMADMCQPMRVLKDMKQEYDVATYIKAAWTKMLVDPEYRKTPGAAAEPHLPDGVTLNTGDKKTALPKPFPSIKLSTIGELPYEEIIDPTHPFSPRWDYQYNERDHYSPKTSDYMSKYSDNSKAVYCAGDRADSGDAKKDKDYKVDVLEFRRDAFDSQMTKRIDYNKQCYNDKSDEEVDILLGWTTSVPPLPIPNPIGIAKFKAKTYCFQMVEPPIYPLKGKYKKLPCWRCYGLEGKVDDSSEEQYPPCSTRYDQPKDRRMVAIVDGLPILPGGKNNLSFNAQCGKSKIDALCKDLRKPFTPMNKLKMRYHNPEGTAEDGGGSDTTVLKEGVQEGLWFKEYFGNHMPYPRLWDTGQSIQKNNDTDQDANDDLGQYTAIVGVGREASPDGTKPDQRCLYGGWGGDTSVGGAPIKVPDPVTSWTELKLYQSYTSRETKIVCMGRYEKAFKYRSAENQLLVSAGGIRTSIVNSRCQKNSDGRALEKCKYLEKSQIAAAGAADANEWSNVQQIQMADPLQWHGYLSAKKEDDRFPNFGLTTRGKGVHTGLDNVKCGDIIILDKGGAGDGEKPGLPKLAQVIDVNLPNRNSCFADEPSTCVKDKNCHIQVQEADNGKLPDVCGSTDMVGELKTRYIYKPGNFPADKADVLKKLNNWTKSCTDTRLALCEMAPWDTLKFYRPTDDIRQGKAP